MICGSLVLGQDSLRIPCPQNRAIGLRSVGNHDNVTVGRRKTLRVIFDTFRGCHQGEGLVAYVVKKARDENVLLDVPGAILSIAFALPMELLVPKLKIWRRIFWCDLEFRVIEKAVINNGNRILISLRSGEKHSIEAWRHSVQVQ